MKPPALLLGLLLTVAAYPAAAQDNGTLMPIIDGRVFYVDFDSGDSRLTSGGRRTLGDVAEYMVVSITDHTITPEQLHIVVVGYADRSGSAAFNIELSRRRAIAVADGLVELGIPHDAIAVDWKGETFPIVATSDGVSRRENRRVEIWPAF